MQSRRNFIGKVATGLAGTLASSNVLGANDRIRLGIIGPGAVGSVLLEQLASQTERLTRDFHIDLRLRAVMTSRVCSHETVRASTAPNAATRARWVSRNILMSPGVG